MRKEKRKRPLADSSAKRSAAWRARTAQERNGALFASVTESKPNRLRRARRQGRRSFGLNLGNLGRVGAVLAILWFGGLALVAGTIFTLAIVRMIG